MFVVFLTLAKNFSTTSMLCTIARQASGKQQFEAALAGALGVGKSSVKATLSLVMAVAVAIAMSMAMELAIAIANGNGIVCGAWYVVRAV